MNRRKSSIFATFYIFCGLCTLCVFPGVTHVFGQTELHGADSVFQKNGMAILWAILKGPDEERSWVYIKILYPEDDPRAFQIFSVEAVDPFAKEREWEIKGKKLRRENVIRSLRSSFKDKAERRILFYRDTAEYDSEKPAMTIFYMGVPDTSPELLSEKEVNDYFEKALGRLKK